MSILGGKRKHYKVDGTALYRGNPKNLASWTFFKVILPLLLAWCPSLHAVKLYWVNYIHSWGLHRVVTNTADCFSQALLPLVFKCRPAARKWYINCCCKPQLLIVRCSCNLFWEHQFPQTENTDTVLGHLIHFSCVFWAVFVNIQIILSFLQCSLRYEWFKNVCPCVSCVCSN